LCRSDASFVLLREDIGRHNAVDKVLGRRLLDNALPAQGHALVVSGRVSFEIVQKALAGGVPLVVAVSAPSSMAIEAAELGGITLVAFARQQNVNVYTHPARIVASGA
jgi:FdhD protein